jgi:hypothetical protein
MKKFKAYFCIVVITLWLSMLYAYALTRSGILDEDQEKSIEILVKKGETVNYTFSPNGTSPGFIGTAYLEASQDSGASYQIAQTFIGTLADAITEDVTGSYSNERIRNGVYLRFRIENIDDANTSDSVTCTLAEREDVNRRSRLNDGEIVSKTTGSRLLTLYDNSVQVASLRLDVAPNLSDTGTTTWATVIGIDDLSSPVDVFLSDEHKVAGKIFVIKNLTDSSTALTIHVQSGLLDEGTNISITEAFGAKRIYSNGTNWFTW